MTATKPPMKMPELLVFAKPLVIGFIGAELWRMSFYLGSNYAPTLSNLTPWVTGTGFTLGTLICVVYAYQRQAHVVALRMVKSLRIDLLVATSIGILANQLAISWFDWAHIALKDADPLWAPVLIFFLYTLLLSPILQQYVPKPKRTIPQLYFIADEEIKTEQEDLLSNSAQAKTFAETVLKSGAHPGLIFGVDGPWGIGKTSFINLAERYWEEAQNEVIVCRFEPLRYASEPNLSDLIVRDLSASIQRKVFAPEFKPAASRYSQLIKGKADFSFLGFKLSLEPSHENVDQLLNDIDEVLKRIGRRAIIVIDDLDRLDAKTINNVLFATRRTFNLSQATYVLCYDTEVLARNQDEGSKAREFLEKFVTVKLSLFVDSSSISGFLRKDWQSTENRFGAIPADTMLKFNSILTDLAKILDDDLGAYYLPLLGDLRKVKRFINAMLLMKIEEVDLSWTDFNNRDLIHLILLHLNFPGVFRRIYAEETENRRGIFSVRINSDEIEYRNAVEFIDFLKQLEQQETVVFLLKELFDVSTLALLDENGEEEKTLASRACFNHGSFRNLEKYLKLIVRFAVPEPQESFVLYQNAVNRIKKGESIASILESPDFRLSIGEHSHDKFWRILVNQSHDFTRPVAEECINALISYIARYSATRYIDQGLRQRSIYTLSILLDRSGWGRATGSRRQNTVENIIEIAWWIYGEHSHKGKGILQSLISSDRGVLGWYDLILFRLNCSADRHGQLHNLYSALILDQDRKAETSGSGNYLAKIGMKKLSQEVYSLFKKEYIVPKRNFLSEVNATPNKKFLGEALSYQFEHGSIDDCSEQHPMSLEESFKAARNAVKVFVVYQLSNSFGPSGSGVGCGHYDEIEDTEGNGFGIARAMNDYMFDVCFNPDIGEENIFHFIDHCLSHLSNSFFSGADDDAYIATKKGIPGGLDPKKMGLYWRRHQKQIRQLVENEGERTVVTANYIASYGDNLNGVFTVLNELANEPSDDDLIEKEA